MVEQPRRVAERMATWFREGWCRHAVFNLKLPMKKRWDETRLCLALVAAGRRRPLHVRARQLYHDREEITVFATTLTARLSVQQAFRRNHAGLTRRSSQRDYRPRVIHAGDHPT